jgi:hypothetical protein
MVGKTGARADAGIGSTCRSHDIHPDIGLRSGNLSPVSIGRPAVDAGPHCATVRAYRADRR